MLAARLNGNAPVKVISAHVSPCLALVILAFGFAYSQPAAFAQEAPTAKSFEGVWKITKVVAKGVTDSNPQPSLQIFSRGYFSIIRTNSSEARKASPPSKDPDKLTDAEKIARYDEWAPYAASAGTCEVKGNTLITHNVVAKMVMGMTLTEEATIKFEGNTFVASPMPGQPNSGRQTTYTRLR